MGVTDPASVATAMAMSACSNCRISSPSSCAFTMGCRTSASAVARSNQIIDGIRVAARLRLRPLTLEKAARSPRRMSRRKCGIDCFDSSRRRAMVPRRADMRTRRIPGVGAGGRCRRCSPPAAQRPPRPPWRSGRCARCRSLCECRRRGAPPRDERSGSPRCLVRPGARLAELAAAVAGRRTASGSNDTTAATKTR